MIHYFTVTKYIAHICLHIHITQSYIQIIQEICITNLEISCEKCIVYNNNNFLIIGTNKVHYFMYIQYFKQRICWTLNPDPVSYTHLNSRFPHFSYTWIWLPRAGYVSPEVTHTICRVPSAQLSHTP